MIVETQTKLALRAQWITLVIVLSFVGLFVLAVRSGQELAGAAAGMGALATIIYALNGGRFRRGRGAPATEAASPSEVDRESE